METKDVLRAFSEAVSTELRSRKSQQGALSLGLHASQGLREVRLLGKLIVKQCLTSSHGSLLWRDFLGCWAGQDESAKADRAGCCRARSQISTAPVGVYAPLQRG